MKQLTFLLIILLAPISLTFAQNANQAAVDTLTKDVAAAVFAKINQPKAQEIYQRLLSCGDGCDPQQIIRDVGSWDQVGAKMQELSELKNTQRFQAMSPGEANTTIRQQLAKFYATHKAEKPYSVPLSPTVQQNILAKIDGLLPPAEVVAPTPSASVSPTATEPVSDEETDVSATTSQSSSSESQSKQDKQFWMILISVFGGLLGGAAAVYFLLYRDAKAEVDRLKNENNRLSQSLDTAQRSRPKPANEPRQAQNADRQKAQAYDTILAELGTGGDPLVAIRQLKQAKSAPALNPTPPVRSVEPTVEPVVPIEPVPSQVQPVSVQPSPTSSPATTRSEVFYFPPPDPNGQFDIAQKSGTLSPESAYRFSISADNPALATFRFEAEPGRVARFLTYRNYMIEPACDSENSYSSTYTRIVMRRDGEATLDNGSWRVKTKALIRYE